MTNENILFTTAIDLTKHPMLDKKIDLKIKYYTVLNYFVKSQLDNQYTIPTLKEYKEKLLGNYFTLREESKIEKSITKIISSRFQPWKNKYRYWMISDIALILMNDELTNNAVKEMKTYLSKKQQVEFEVFFDNLTNKDIQRVIKGNWDNEMAIQYKKNKEFINHKIDKYIVTATISAGKSTLINALIGKPLTKTSQEICTNNTCYLYNKPYEDGKVRLENESFSDNITFKELKNISWESETRIASNFIGINKIYNRICIIDTPGVNSAINSMHRRISQKVLKEDTYKRVIYVINACKIATDEDFTHLKWILDNVENHKVIFVLNKLDSFNSKYDNILESIEGIKKDLISIGYENPIICPISANFAVLIKMKANGDKLSEDENDEYIFYSKKFKKTEYDLSKYYEGVDDKEDDSEIISLSKKCGLYGLEKTLFGGNK